MTLSIEEESAMNWMAGCILIVTSITYPFLHFAGSRWIILVAACSAIIGIFHIFKSIKQIKLFTKRDLDD